MDIRLKFVSSYYKKGAIKPTHMTTNDMLADILIKTHPSLRLQVLLTLDLRRHETCEEVL